MNNNIKNNLIQNFKRHFGNDLVSFYASPGRTEIGGNHTDHQNGCVLATAVNMYIYAAAMPSDEPVIEIYSEGHGHIRVAVSEFMQSQQTATEHLKFDMSSVITAYKKGTSEALVLGVIAGLSDMGHNVGGFKAYIVGEIPEGSGLSSSAAFEVLIGKIINDFYNYNSISYVELAQAGQFAENEYFGKPCGLMDQLACASEGILYMDLGFDGCPIIEKIKFDFGNAGYSICITDTGGSHANLTDEYAAITGEMERVAAIFGKEKLRGITSEKLLAKARVIREKVGDRALLRALHFADENGRAKAEAEALKEGDFEKFLELVCASGNSSYKLLQNIYPAGEARRQGIAVGLAVSELVLAEDGVCRVHGGGFAGTIQAFVKTSALKRYVEAMDGLFGKGACKVVE